MHKLLLLISAFFIGNFASAQVQESVEPCGHRELMDQLEKQYPGFKKQMDIDYLKLVNSDFPKVEKRKKIIRDTIFYEDTIYTVPVVFHVLYSNSAENIHDSLLINQIEVLNRDFRRNNFDTVNTRSFFKSRAGDVKIQFVLAKVDPNGNVTTGIVRKSTSTAFWGGGTGINNKMKSSYTKGSSPWNPKKYVNVWVCDLTNSSGADALLGFAYPPFQHPSWTGTTATMEDSNQGVVLHYKIVGRNNPLSNTATLNTSRMGRVAVHEFGHYFGLRHIWADDQFSPNRCLVDDYIDDTPLQGIGSNFNCNFNLNSCIEPKNDLPDMVENYMDYSTHQCQNMFTKRQAITMRNAITQFRYDLPIQVEIIKKYRVIDTVVYDQVLIYPVAKDNRLKIEVRNDDIVNNISYEVYNMVGQKIEDNKIINSNMTEISTSRYAKATYIVILRTLGGRVIKNQKVIID